MGGTRHTFHRRSVPPRNAIDMLWMEQLTLRSASVRAKAENLFPLRLKSSQGRQTQEQTLFRITQHTHREKRSLPPIIFSSFSLPSFSPISHPWTGSRNEKQQASSVLILFGADFSAPLVWHTILLRMLLTAVSQFVCCLRTRATAVQRVVRSSVGPSVLRKYFGLNP